MNYEMQAYANKKVAILDADGFIFMAAWPYRNELNTLNILAAQSKLDRIIENVLKAVQPDYFIGFLGKSGSKTFRHEFATLKPYKGNREGETWHDFFKKPLKDHMHNKWNFHYTERIEADDCVVITFHLLKEKNAKCILVSEDKDNLQIGEHLQFNPDSSKFCFIEHSQEQGRKFFYKQWLMGDSTDNIGGVKGVGKKNELLVYIDQLQNPTEQELYNLVRAKYINVYGADYLLHFIENYVLLKMLDKPSFDYPKSLNIQPYTKVPTENSNILKTLL